MSIKVMSWVMDDAPVDNTTEMVVLYVLADHAKDDGTCAWPSQATIADKTRCSQRTVARHLKSLEERGLIRRGDQRHVAHLPADRRPVVWDLNVTMKRNTPESTGCQNVTPRTNGMTSSAQRHDNGGSNGMTSSAQRHDTGVIQTVLEPSIEPSMNLSPSTDGRGHVDPFDEFWDSYPRKIGDKKKTRDKFTELATEHGHESLIIAAKNYRAETEQYETQTRFIQYPSTFLNKGTWKDYQRATSARATRSDVAQWNAVDILGQQQAGGVGYDCPF